MGKHAKKKQSKKKYKKPVSPTSWRRRMNLKDMRMLSSHDEAFHLSEPQIRDIIYLILERETPTPETYRHWDEYAQSFYLKMCSCYGVDHHNLEEGMSYEERMQQLEMYEEGILQDEDEDMEDRGVNQPNVAKKMSHEEEFLQQDEDMENRGVNQPNVAKKMSHEEEQEFLRQLLSRRHGFRRSAGPYKFGSYACGTTPVGIPHHLYLLVEEAVDIMKRFEWHDDPNDLIDLETVEKKISFFCKFFHSHLPTGWKYERDNASTLLGEGYDLMDKRRSLMASYTCTHINDLVGSPREDVETQISPKDMAGIMRIVHSRKTPRFWGMSWVDVSFYCKLCSSFDIDYRDLEAASEDDVCLMATGGKPRRRMIRFEENRIGG